MNWLWFCQAAFPHESSEFTVIDYLGYTWKLFMDFCHDEGVSCVFSGQWKALCDARKLTKGMTIKLGVTGTTNNRVVYLCAPLMLVMRTKMPPSACAGEGGPCYRFEE